MRTLLAVLCCLVALPALGQGVADTGSPPEALGAPRVCLPSAHLVGKHAVSGAYTFRGASHEGRDMAAHQFDLAVGVTERIELDFDYNEIGVDGRTPGNTLDTHSTGWQVRYGQELFNAPGALFFQYRTSDGRVVSAGNTRIPPDANTMVLGAVRSSPWGDKREVHLLGSVSRSEVGDQNAITLLGGAGLDWGLTKDLSARGDVALIKETGDLSSFEAAISGGLHYERSGFTADVAGTFLPSGTPIAGNPLADASVFGLYPIFGNSGVAHDLANDALGFVTVRVGYTRQF